MKNSLIKLFEGFFCGVVISVLLSPVWILFFAVLCFIGNITRDMLGMSDGCIFSVGVIVSGIFGAIINCIRGEDDGNAKFQMRDIQ